MAVESEKECQSARSVHGRFSNERAWKAAGIQEYGKSEKQKRNARTAAISERDCRVVATMRTRTSTTQRRLPN